MSLQRLVVPSYIIEMAWVLVIFMKYELGKCRLKSYEVTRYEKHKRNAETMFIETSEALKR
jgi:hypothetical protein